MPPKASRAKRSRITDEDDHDDMPPQFPCKNTRCTSAAAVPVDEEHDEEDAQLQSVCQAQPAKSSKNAEALRSKPPPVRRPYNTAATHGSTVNMQVMSYEGEDFVAGGAVLTPAQMLGASGILDPEGTPWPELLPLIYMQQTYLQVMALQGHHTEHLLHEANLITLGTTSDLPMTCNPAPFPELDLLMSIKVRASELEDEVVTTAPCRTVNRPPGSAAAGSARESCQSSRTPMTVVSAPVSQFSSRIDTTPFASRASSASASGPSSPSAAPTLVPSGFNAHADSPGMRPTTSFAQQQGFPQQQQQQQYPQYQQQQQYQQHHLQQQQQQAYTPYHDQHQSQAYPQYQQQHQQYPLFQQHAGQQPYSLFQQQPGQLQQQLPGQLQQQLPGQLQQQHGQQQLDLCKDTTPQHPTPNALADQ